MNKIQIVTSDVGKKVWNNQLRMWGIIYAVADIACVGYATGRVSKYSLDGTLIAGTTPTLQWEKPKRKVTKTLERWVVFNTSRCETNGDIYIRRPSFNVSINEVVVKLTGTYEVEVDDE